MRCYHCPLSFEFCKTAEDPCGEERSVTSSKLCEERGAELGRGRCGRQLSAGAEDSSRSHLETRSLWTFFLKNKEHQRQKVGFVPLLVLLPLPCPPLCQETSLNPQSQSSDSSSRGRPDALPAQPCSPALRIHLSCAAGLSPRPVPVPPGCPPGLSPRAAPGLPWWWGSCSAHGAAILRAAPTVPPPNPRLRDVH